MVYLLHAYCVCGKKEWLKNAFFNSKSQRMGESINVDTCEPFRSTKSETFYCVNVHLKVTNADRV